MSESRFGIEDLDGLYTKALNGALGYGPKLSKDEVELVINAVYALGQADEELRKLQCIDEILQREFNKGVRCSVCGRTDGGEDCARNC